MVKLNQEESLATVKYPGLLDRILEAFIDKTQREVAEILGITEGAVSQWGRRGNISVDTLLQISDLTGVSINWLLSRKGPKMLVDMQEIDLESIKRQAVIEHLTHHLVDLAAQESGREKGKETKKKSKG